MDGLKKTFGFRPGGRLEVAVDREGLDIQGWDREEVEVSLHGSEPGRRAWEGVRIDAGRSGDSIRVRGCNLFGSDTVVRVMAPRQTDLRLDARRSDVALSGLQGRLELDLGRGLLEGRDLSGRTRLRMSSGECRLTGLRGEMDLETETGSVFVEAAELWGKSRVETGRGTVEIHIAAGQGLSVRTRHLRPWRRLYFKAVLGGGEAEVFARTRWGEIHLHRDGKWVGTVLRGGEVRWKRRRPGPTWGEMVARLRRLH